MKRFKTDLTTAGIEFLNAKGYRADFHSLRHTLATNLARAGTAPRVAMEILRHSDMRLTSKTYTDAGHLPVADAVLRLPSLTHTKTAASQIDSQELFRAGQDVSPTGTKPEANGYFELSEKQQDGQQKDGPFKTSQKIGNGARYRVRTRKSHSATATTCGSRHTRRHTNSFRPDFCALGHSLANPVRRAKEDHLLPSGNTLTLRNSLRNS